MESEPNKSIISEQKKRINQLYNECVNINETSKGTFKNLKEEEITQFKEAITTMIVNGKDKNLKDVLRKAIDPNFIYVYINNIKKYLELCEWYEINPDISNNFLSNKYSLILLHKQGEKCNTTIQNINKNEQYSKDICRVLGLEEKDPLIYKLTKSFIQRKDKYNFVLKELLTMEQFNKLSIKLERYGQLLKHNNSRKKNTITESFLEFLNENKAKVLITNFTYKEINYKLSELFKMSELLVESRELNHCIGDSDTYLDQVKAGTHRIFTIRDSNNIPKWTLFYDISNKTLLQIKGKDNALPDSDFLINVLNILVKQNIQIDKVAEDFEYSILSQEGKIYKEDNLTLDKLLSDNTKVLKGKCRVDKSITKEELTKLTQIEGLTLDLTNVSSELKQEITEVKGGLIDNSKIFGYSKLITVDGGLSAGKAESFLAPSLITVNGELNADSAKSFLVPSLIIVNGGLDVCSVKSFSAPSLTTVNGDLSAVSANDFSAPSLITVNGDLSAGFPYSFSTPSLITVNGDLYAIFVKSFSANTLKIIKGDLYLKENLEEITEMEIDKGVKINEKPINKYYPYYLNLGDVIKHALTLGEILEMVNKN